MHRLESFRRGFNGKPNNCREIFLWKFIHFVFSLAILKVQKFPKRSILTYLDILTHNSPLIQARFFPSSISFSIDFFLVSKELEIRKVIEFVRCVGILIVRKCQKTAGNFDFFLIFQLLFLQFLTMFVASRSQSKVVCFWSLRFKMD